MLSVTVFAASAYSNPAEAVAGLTGRDVDSVIAERRESGESYGTIAEKPASSKPLKPRCCRFVRTSSPSA
jgi:hypothetical protein